MLQECTQLMSACVGIGLEMRDFMSRLHTLLMSTAKLVEDVQGAEHDFPSSKGSVSGNAVAESHLLLQWDLTNPFVMEGHEDEVSVVV